MKFFATVVRQGSGRALQALSTLDDRCYALPLETVCAFGSYVIGRHVPSTKQPDAAEIEEVLAVPGSALSGLYSLLADCELNPLFPPAAEAEAEAWLREPKVDDPTLDDLRHLPFVTIDGEHSRDLDQAAYVESIGQQFGVYYALADASFYVRPGSALWSEAQQRAASYYLPGLMVPMLPRSLSEGLISLNPQVERRALVLHMRLDALGAVLETRALRARIRSRSKLSFGQVESHYRGAPLFAGQTTALVGQELAAVEESLAQLRRVGQARMARGQEQGIIRFRRVEMEANLGAQQQKFIATTGVRREVEAYNEQLSLLCNSEGARLLCEASHKQYVDPIYRVHPPPEDARLEEFRNLTAGLRRAHGLPESPWQWDANQALADYLAALPQEPGTAPVAAAIHRQAVMVNVRSTYQDQPAAHFGVGAEAYARFSAPMREMVGVFLHRELFQALNQGGTEDNALAAQTMSGANRAKSTQKRLTNAVNLLVLDQIFREQLALPLARRGLPAVVLGLSPSQVYVQLDAPPVDAKLQFRTLRNYWNVDSLQLEKDGASVVDAAGCVRLLLGQRVQVQVLRERQGRKHWELGLDSRPQPQ